MKLKSHSAAKKRVKVTGRGKLRVQKSSKQHLLTNKSKRQKRLLRGGAAIFPKNERNIRRLLPYI